MTTYEVERLLDSDALAIRLSQLQPVQVPDRLRLRVLAESRGRPPRLTIRRVVGGVAAVIAALAVLALTPAGGALARAVLPEGLQQRLGLVAGGPTHLSAPSGSQRANTSQPSPPTLVPCSSTSIVPQVSGPTECNPDLSLADAQSRVDFAIPTPSWLPAGVTYRGSSVDSPHSVHMLYLHLPQGSGAVQLTIHDDVPLGGSTVPSGAVQSVTVDGSSAFFVQGAYQDSGPGTSAWWNSNADAEELTWQHDGLTYDLIVGSLRLSHADVVRIADSVR